MAKHNEKKPIIETRTCLICGKEFGINCYQTRKVYCDDCRGPHRLKLAREYSEIHKYEIREKAKIYRQTHRKHMVFICKMCGGEFQTHRGGIPKYCTPCLTEMKDVYPFKIYYNRRMDAECRENWKACFKDAQNSK